MRGFGAGVMRCATVRSMVVSLPREQEEMLSRVAMLAGRSREEIVAEAVGNYLELARWIAESVESARRRTDGELLDHEDVVAMIEGRIGRIEAALDAGRG